MKSVLALLAVVGAALLIGCGGSTDSSLSTTTTGITSSATSGATGSTAGTTGALAGSYAGTFSGSNTQNLSYKGTGSGAIDNAGAATFTYNAKTTGSVQITENRSFIGVVNSAGTFTGYTPQAPSNGGAVQQFPASGTVSQTTSTQLSVTITWAYPYANGGTFYTSTETWNLAKQ